MKKNNKFIWMLAMAGAVMSSCTDEGDPTDGDDGGYAYEFAAVINTYVDDVVLNTYAEMADTAAALYSAVQAYDADPQSQAALNEVCSKWRAMRIPWEQSEGFLFGPAASLSLDPSLDSWPLDKGGIDRIIGETGAIDADRIASSNLHGFHAIEYLIFVDSHPKVVPLEQRERDYLKAAVEYLRSDTYQLYANWAGKGNVSDEVASVLEEAEIDVQFNFAEQFKKAGKAGSTFASQSDAIDQIIDGCVDIAGEVGTQKMGGPYAKALVSYDDAVLEVESWYSWNSLEDYRNNIVSIRSSYFGGRNRTAGNASDNSISAFVKSKNPTLNAEITTAIEAAITAIGAITPPFRNAILGGNNPAIDRAMDACSDLESSLLKIKGLRD